MTNRHLSLSFAAGSAIFCIAANVLVHIDKPMSIFVAVLTVIWALISLGFSIDDKRF